MMRLKPTFDVATESAQAGQRHFQASSMELAAYLAEQYVEKHIATPDGTRVTVVCSHYSILKTAYTRLGGRMSADRHVVMRSQSASAMCRVWVGAIVGIGTMLAASLSHSQSFGNSTHGQVLSETWCRSCHLVSAANRPNANDGVPSFQAIARQPSTTSTGLRVFLQTPHPRMPNDVLSSSQTEDIIAYILSLKR